MKLRTLATVLLLVALCMPTFAAYQDKDERMVEKRFEYGVFDNLLKQTVVTLDTSHAITASDNTATNTEAVYMLPDTVTYPIMLRIQNHGTASITYVPYSVTDASGVALPTATASHLLTPQGEAVVSGKAFQGVFYSAPNISIGASGNQEVIIEVWGRSR